MTRKKARVRGSAAIRPSKASAPSSYARPFACESANGMRVLVPLLTRAELEAREEVRDLERRRLRRVGAVHGVCLDRRREVSSDGAGRGLRRIRCAHEIAPTLDDVVALE